MATATDIRCALCGEAQRLLDEHDRCEQCVIDLELIAAQTLAELECAVESGLSKGLTRDQLREVFEMMLTDGEGKAPAIHLRRRRSPVSADWFLEPASAFIENDSEYERNAIARLRWGSGLSRDALARQLGVSVTDVALWRPALSRPITSPASSRTGSAFRPRTCLALTRLRGADGGRSELAPGRPQRAVTAEGLHGGLRGPAGADLDP